MAFDQDAYKAAYAAKMKKESKKARGGDDRERAKRKAAKKRAKDFEKSRKRERAAEELHDVRRMKFFDDRKARNRVGDDAVRMAERRVRRAETRADRREHVEWMADYKARSADADFAARDGRYRNLNVLRRFSKSAPVNSELLEDEDRVGFEVAGSAAYLVGALVGLNVWRFWVLALGLEPAFVMLPDVVVGVMGVWLLVRRLR